MLPDEQCYRWLLGLESLNKASKSACVLLSCREVLGSLVRGTKLLGSIKL